MGLYQSFVRFPNWKALEGKKLEIVLLDSLVLGKAEDGVLYFITRVNADNKEAGK